LLPNLRAQAHLRKKHFDFEASYEFSNLSWYFRSIDFA
jgi:hypothetical protein